MGGAPSDKRDGKLDISRRELTGRRAATKLLKLSSRGSSLVERRPEKAGVASSILAPGTIRTYIPQQIPLSTQLVSVSFRSERDFHAVLCEFRLRPWDFSGESPLNDTVIGGALTASVKI